jgi:hypothetical protein
MSYKLREKIRDLQRNHYRIEVLGKVRPEVLDHFDCAIDRITEDKTGEIVTSLLVHVRDQAELTGVINLLNNWRLFIVSVNREVY